MSEDEELKPDYNCGLCGEPMFSGHDTPIMYDNKRFCSTTCYNYYRFPTKNDYMEHLKEHDL